MSTPGSSFPQVERFEFNSYHAAGSEILDPAYRAIINTDKPLADTGYYKVAAEVKLATDDAFLILNVRESPSAGAFIFPFLATEKGMMLKDDVEFLLVSQEFNPEDSNDKARGYMAITRGTPLVLGRLHERDHFEYASRTSRTHAEILLDEMGNLTVHDLGSRNGTGVRAEEVTREPEGDYQARRLTTELSVVNAVRQAQQTKARRIRQQKSPDLFEYAAKHHGISNDSGETHQSDPAVRKEQEAQAQRIREQEEAEIRARQARQNEINEIKRAERAAEAEREEQARREIQQKMARRRQEIEGLEEPVRSILQKTDHKNRLIVQIPLTLTVENVAQMLRKVLDARQKGGSDVAIFKGLARQFHPDQNGGTASVIQEEQFKLLGSIYDTAEKQFIF